MHEKTTLYDLYLLDSLHLEYYLKLNGTYRVKCTVTIREYVFFKKERDPFNNM